MDTGHTGYQSNTQKEILYDDFESGKKRTVEILLTTTGTLNPQIWKVGKTQWGGCFDAYCDQPGNGGVIPDNVFIKEGPTGERYNKLTQS